MIDAGEVFGYYVITRQYFDRYRCRSCTPKPTSRSRTARPALAEEGMDELRVLKRRRRADLGFTWFSLTDQSIGIPLRRQRPSEPAGL